MKKHLHYVSVAGLTLLFANMFTSCIDQSFDLTDTDYTVGVETNITLPSCSTGDIYLHNFMDLKQEDVVQYVWSEELQDSFLCVRETGNPYSTNIHIGEIRIAQPNISQINTTINLRKMAAQGSRVKVNIDTPTGPQEIEIADRTFHYDLKDNDVKYTIQNATASHISYDIYDIRRVGIDEVEVTLNFNLSGFPKYMSIIHLDNMRMILPQGLEIHNCTFNGKPCSEKDGVIYITEEKNKGVNTNEALELKMTLKGAHAGEAFTFDKENRIITLHGDFTVNGSFRVESKEFDTAELQKELNTFTEQELQSFLAGDWNMLIPNYLEIKGNAHFNKDIVINRFSGEVAHFIDTLPYIYLNNMPDFLNEEEVILDLDNPILLLEVEHDLPATANTAFLLYSSSCPEPVCTNTFYVNPGNNKFYLADKKAQGLPDNYRDAQQLPTTGSIPALIRRIPKYLHATVKNVHLNIEDMDITRNYHVNINYGVFAPFTFGENFRMVYSQTEQGWAIDMGDLENLDAELLELKGKIDSSLPAECELTLVPIDEYGNEIDALKVSRVHVPANAKNQEILLQIRAAEGYTFNDVLAGKNGVNRLDGVKYTARLLGKPNATLTRGAGLKLHEAQISIKGTVTYDAN